MGGFVIVRKGGRVLGTEWGVGLDGVGQVGV